jgi:hypothetical protein
MARSLYRRRQPSLMLGAGPCLAPGHDLPVVINKSSECVHILVLNGLHPIYTKRAHFASGPKLPGTEASPGRTSCGPSLLPTACGKWPRFSPNAFDVFLFVIFNKDFFVCHKCLQNVVLPASSESGLGIVIFPTG